MKRLVKRVLFSMTFFILYPMLLAAAEGAAAPASTGMERIVMSVTAMCSVACSCLASAYALARIGSSALGAMSEKPEIGGRAIVFLGMAEGIAIYGLIVAIMLVNRI